MKYRVLIKAVVNVCVDEIDAESQLKAIERAQEINPQSHSAFCYADATLVPPVLSQTAKPGLELLR